MGLALLLVAILLYASNRARCGKVSEANQSQRVVIPTVRQQKGAVATRMSWLIRVALVLTFVQIILGTQVREEIDRIASAAGYGQRDTWVAALGSVFEAHRTLSAIVVLANVVIGYQLWTLGVPRLRRLMLATWIVLGLEMVAGITLAYYALPAFVQPVHLTLATLLFGTQFLTLLALQPRSGVGKLQPVVQPLQQAHSY